MSSETDNFEYTGICMWDSCVVCPHKHDCEDGIKEEEDKETDD